MTKRNDFPVATESQEQQAVFEWARVQKAAYPELGLLFAVPNGGARNAVTGARLKAEGVKPGVPDMVLLVPRGDEHGLCIELKSLRKGARPSPEQIAWMDALKAQGYAVALCYGADAAIAEIARYLRGEGTHNE